MKRKSVLITGGGGGLGEAVAFVFAEAGARILLVGRGEEKLKAVREKISPLTEAEILSGDVSDSAFCDSAVAESVKRFGGLDVLINNAGIIVRADARQTSDDGWLRTIAINLNGTFFMSRAAVGEMQKSGGGAIVNVASTLGLVGCAGLAAYCASKGGVVQLTRAMALENASSGITVNAVCPGAIDTPMLVSGHSESESAEEILQRNRALIPKDEIASAAEVARAIIFLARESHITGAMLSVDGGYTAG